MSEDFGEIQLVIGIPADESDRDGVPYQPDPNVNYQRRRCAKCDIEVIVGEKQLTIVDRFPNTAEIICPKCVVKHYKQHIDNDTMFRNLTDGTDSRLLPDDMVSKEFEPISDLKQLAKEMVLSAKKYRFDFSTILDEANEMGGTATPKSDGMVRIQGSVDMPSLAPLTRFVYYKGQPYQVQFNLRPDNMPDNLGPGLKDYAQLTVNNIMQNDLDQDVLDEFLFHFMDTSRRVISPATPNHVAVRIQIIEDQWTPTAFRD
jgi:hypothetical protein